MLGRDREADGETRSPTASCSGFEPQNAPCTLVWTLSLDFLIRKWGDGMGNCTSWRPQVSCVRGSHRQGAQLMGAIRSQLWTGEAYPPISGGWDQGFSCPVLSHQPLPPPPHPPWFLTARETTANSRLQWGKERPQVRFFQRVASVIPWANGSFAHRVGTDETSQKVT